MFLFEFPAQRVSPFQPGTFPKAFRISHTFDNPTWHYAIHVHRDLVELIYVAGGTADIVIGKQRYQAKKGDILFAQAGQPHSISSQPDDPSDVWTLMAADVHFATPYEGNLVTMHTQSGERAPVIHQMLEQIQALSDELDNGGQVVCDYLCAGLVALFRDMLSHASVTFDQEPPTLAAKVLRYLDQNYNQDIDLKALEQMFFLSASHISREFRNEYHISPINYVIDKRLSEAKWLLVTTDISVQEISLQMGYENVYYFIRLFTKRVGFSPVDYRTRFTSPARGKQK